MADDTPQIDINLDTLDREATPRAFAAVLGGKRYECKDPMEIGTQTLLRMKDSSDMWENLELILGDHYQTFIDQDYPLWKVMKFYEAVGHHYGLTTGEPGESAASRNT